jgi:hypothetical protein
MTQTRKRISTKSVHKVPVWQECTGCGDFVCNIHGGHVYDCACPAIEFWSAIGVNPYLHEIKRKP